jgi:glycosyltransferase involved in cell wall biosynthesis
MRIAMIGTRGVPAAYGGFETAVEEIGRRLVERGHDVIVYTRTDDRRNAPREYLGMQLVPLPAVRSKAFETLTHTASSTAHAVAKCKPDMAFLFNAANAIYLPPLRARKIPVATHVDGLEWQRTKWGKGGRKIYRMSESIAVRYSDALIADAQGIADYYTQEFGATTDLIAYGAPILARCNVDLLDADLSFKKFHVLVARFEPENHVAEGVLGYTRSDSVYPLLVVGGAPFAAEYTESIQAIADSDPRVQMLGPVWDQDRLDALYSGALTYIHGHSVGGTNPSLLRAMGAATATIAYDVGFNREVLGDDGRFFADPAQLTTQLNRAEAESAEMIEIGKRLQRRAEQRYNWDEVAAKYEDLAARLAAGESQAGRFKGRRASSH